MRRCFALRHVAFEDLGGFAPAIAGAGYAVETLHMPTYGGMGPTVERDDLLVVLGGPIGAYEPDWYPFLRTERDIIGQALDAGARVLGVCLGAQLLALTLGASVYPGGAKEIGFAPLALTEAGRASPLTALGDLPVLHWHGDTFDLPPGATLLASTGAYANQAFSIGRRTLGLQFHPEATGAAFENWLVGHAAELAASGMDPNVLRSDARTHGPALQRACHALTRAWLGED
jgi:GMP synthase (glutamine-hydrolysing)